MKNTTLIGFIIAVFFTFNTHAQNRAIQTDSKPVTKIIKVKGVTCAADLNTLADNVKKLDGIIRIETLTQGATSKFEVTYDSEKVEYEKIVAAIENTGGCSDPNEKPYRVKP